MKYLSFLIMLLISIPAIAQDKKLVNLNDLDGTVVTPYNNKWNVNLYKDGELVNEVQFWTDYAQVFKINGTEYIHRVQDIYNGEGLSEIWINVIRRSDLKPVRYSRITTKGQYKHIDFSDESVMVSKRDTSGSIVKNKFEINQEVFDWNLYGMLLVGLPFQEDKMYNIPFWSDKNTVDTLSARIVEQQTIKDLSDKEYQVYKIDTDRRLTFWLTKKKPYVIKLELILGEGKKLVWEKI